MRSIVKDRRNEILITVIGVIAVVSTALISNWDTLWAEGEILEATYVGYHPNGNFRAELRYFLQVSGTLATVQARAQGVAQEIITEEFSEHLEDADEIEALIMGAYLETLSLDEMVETMLPVYREHFTVEELQDLNRLYSTEVMQRLVNKASLVAEDAAPLEDALLAEFGESFGARLESILNRT